MGIMFNDQYGYCNGLIGALLGRIEAAVGGQRELAETLRDARWRVVRTQLHDTND